MKVLFDGLYTKFTSTPHNSFYTDISGKMYFEEAPQSVTKPYCVYNSVTDVSQFYMGGISGGKLDSVLIQLTIFGATAVNVEACFTDLKALFDDCIFNITGKTLVWMKRETARIFKDDNSIWCRSVDYRCYLE